MRIINKTLLAIFFVLNFNLLYSQTKRIKTVSVYRFKKLSSYRSDSYNVFSLKGEKTCVEHYNFNGNLECATNYIDNTMDSLYYNSSGVCIKVVTYYLNDSKKSDTLASIDKKGHAEPIIYKTLFSCGENEICSYDDDGSLLEVILLANEQTPIEKYILEYEYW